MCSYTPIGSVARCLQVWIDTEWVETSRTWQTPGTEHSVCIPYRTVQLDNQHSNPITLEGSGQHCDNHVAIGGDPDGYGMTLQECAADTVLDPRCSGRFFYWGPRPDDGGQCKCAIDDCSARTSAPQFNVYRYDQGKTAHLTSGGTTRENINLNPGVECVRRGSLRSSGLGPSPRQSGTVACPPSCSQ